jgi:hypothetical protein
MTFPTSYDDDSTLIGDLADQKTLILRAPCTNVDTLLRFETIVGVSVPTYIRLGNELIYMTGSSDNNATVVRPGNATAHNTGDSAFIVLTAEHLNILRDRSIETQKYQGLVGLDASKPAVPEVTEVYVATDTQRVYVCLVAGQWSLLGGATSHADLLLNGETDDHSQYFTQDRLTAWHGTIGGDHVTDGDNHDHRYGTGAARVKTATAATLPNKGVGYVRLATDTSELFIGTGATTWIAITGAPSGAIMIMQQADLALYSNNCPPGWTRYTALDGRFPKGAPAGIITPLNSGGASTHTHTYSQVSAHSHTIADQTFNTSSDGSHKHTFTFQSGSSGSGLSLTASSSASSSVSTGSGGSHSHSITFPATTTATAGSVSTATSSAASSMPPYQEVVFCKKD